MKITVRQLKRLVREALVDEGASVDEAYVAFDRAFGEAAHAVEVLERAARTAGDCQRVADLALRVGAMLARVGAAAAQFGDGVSVTRDEENGGGGSL